MSILMPPPAFATPRSVSFRGRPDAAGALPRAVLLRTARDVEAIADDWRALESATPEATGFQSYEWCRAWMRACGEAGEDRWRVVAVWRGDRLLALWPLQRDRLAGARVLSWLGEPWSQYGDALVAEGPERLPALAAAWREIAAWRDVDLVKLGRVRADAALTALPGFMGATAIHLADAPYVDLSPGVSRPPDRRLRRRRERLDAFGSVAFSLVTEPRARREAVREALALKRRWLAAHDFPSAGLSHAATDAHLEDFAASRRLVIGRLSAGDRTAALELGLATDRRFRSLLGCMDPDFASGSPGHLLIGHMIDWSRGQGFDAYDLMLPADEYKRRWASDSVGVVDHLAPMTLRGRAAAQWFRARPTVKAMHGRLPPALRRALTTLSGRGASLKSG